MKGIKVDEKVVYDNLLKKLKGYSGADVANVCRDAAMMPMRKKLASGAISITEMAKMDQSELDVPITMEDFMDAIKNISKSVSQANLDEYAKWMKEFGCT